MGKNKTAYRLGSIFTWRYRNAVAAAIEKGMASRTDAPLFHFSDHPEADLRWRTFLSLLYVGFSALAWVATVLINQRMAHRQPQSARVVRQG
jgi:hypothetical protein